MKKVIVIGAGIVGASTAYQLARLGAEVTLIDRFDKGQATDAAAGIICPWVSQRRNKAWYKLVQGGARYYPTLIQQLKEDGEENTGYEKVGAICLHTDQDKLEKMAERAITRREDAPEIGEVIILTPEETKELFPPLADEYGSVLISGGARVDGRALRDSFIKAAKKRGIRIINGSASLLNNETKVYGVTVEGKPIEADEVIVTAGAWAKELFKPLHIHFLVNPQKAQVVHLEMTNEPTEKWPVIMPPNNQYILSFEGGRVVVGATHEDDVGFDYRVTPNGLNEIFSKALQVAPGLGESTLVETRVGFRPFTPGFLPVIGRVPNLDGVFVANGLGASGLTSGPYIGAELAKLALGKETELDLSLYDVAGAIE
ncbi:MAG: FAD-binding oxidoreductase [Bacillaceae bacterium]|nr:FAD-binding oxidoreductase [Bacillaceae bacterium]